MRLGTENRRNLVIMVVLLAIGVYLFARMMQNPGGSAASRESAAQAKRAPANQPTRRAANTRGRSPALSLAPTVDPTLRLDLLRVSEESEYEPSGRNIFQLHVERPRVIAQDVEPIDKPITPPVVDPGPPPPPPINLKFYGFASRAGEPRRVFLSEGEDIFVGGEGDIINRRYRILRIGQSSVEVEDILNNTRQSLPLTQG